MLHLREEELCKCGCGAKSIHERADDAVLLAKGREAARLIRPKLVGRGRSAEQAEHLLWSWARAESPLDEWVHDLPRSGFLGLPSPRWVTSFVRRANTLASDKPRRTR